MVMFKAARQQTSAGWKGGISPLEVVTEETTQRTRRGARVPAAIGRALLVPSPPVSLLAALAALFLV